MEYEGKIAKSTNPKIINELAKYRVYCKCGHYVYIYPVSKREKKICSWCGHYVYVDKKTEFKDRLKKTLGNW